MKCTIWRGQPERSLNNMRKEITYCSHPSENKFLNLTRNYIDDLFSSVTNKDLVMVDQLVPPINIERYLRYFNNIQAIVVDRDPRDIFILEKYIWKDGVIPSDVKSFCKWFLYTRSAGIGKGFLNINVTFVQFEDMVYKYEKTTTNLMKWLGLTETTHREKGAYFNPELSKKNTRLWEKIDVNPKDIEYIESKLSNYLYSY